MPVEVVHFDVNKTIIATDKASGQSEEVVVDGLVARNIFGCVVAVEGAQEDDNQSFGVPRPGKKLPSVPPRTFWRFRPVAPDDPVLGGKALPPARVLEAFAGSHAAQSGVSGRSLSIKQNKAQLRALLQSTMGGVHAEDRGPGLLVRVEKMGREGRVTSLETFLQEYAYPRIPLSDCESRGYSKKEAKHYNKVVAKHFRRRVQAALIRGLAVVADASSEEAAAAADGDTGDRSGSLPLAKPAGAPAPLRGTKPAAVPAPATHEDANRALVLAASASDLAPMPDLKVSLKQL